MKHGLLSLAVFILLFNPMMPALLPAGTDYAFHKQIGLLATPPADPAFRSTPDFAKRLNRRGIATDRMGWCPGMPGRLSAGRENIFQPVINGFEAKPGTFLAQPEKHQPANPSLLIKRIQVYTNSFNFRENNTAAGAWGEAGIPLHPPSRICMPEAPFLVPERLVQCGRADADKLRPDYPVRAGFDLPLEQIHATLSVGMDKRRINDRKESSESFDNLKISWSPNFAVAINKIRQYLAGFYHGSPTHAPHQERKIRPELILAGVKVKY